MDYYFAGHVFVNDENMEIINKELADSWLSENSSQIKYKLCKKKERIKLEDTQKPNSSNNTDSNSNTSDIDQDSEEYINSSDSDEFVE